MRPTVCGTAQSLNGYKTIKNKKKPKIHTQ